MRTQVREQLSALQTVLQQHNLWEINAPSADKLSSSQPFALDTLSPTQWLQWVFIPRMHALLDASADLPRDFAISPYLEESLAQEGYLGSLLTPMQTLESLLKSEPRKA